MSEDLLNQLLLARGLETPEQREQFLQPSYARDIADPFLLSGMEQAVARVLQAIKNTEKIIIFADYDADGVPGAAVLAEFFRKIKFSNFEVYIPNRHTEDYGLMEKSVREFAANQAKLIITIDCGISNFAEVKLANELGLDVIITDHHLPPPVLPGALAIVNPKVGSENYPDKMLCGAGVIFKLVQALIARGDFNLDKNWEKTLLDLVAIATISDRVPLLAENRALAKFGLLILQRTPRPGLLALLQAGKIKQKYITEDDIGYMLAPRLNAASRMSHASEAYFLLTTKNPAEAQAMAAHLENKNSERKKLVEGIMQTAESKIPADDLPELIVLGDKTWSPGVLGLAASKLVEKFSRPVFLWGGNNGEVKGSCRSDGTINLVELMRAVNRDDPPAGGFFSNLGGHAMAGGFSLAAAKVAELEQKLLEAHAQAEKLEPEAENKFDAAISIDEVDERAWRLLEQLAPFGPGNPKPIFYLPNIEIAQARTFGNGGIHLELSFKKSNPPSAGWRSGEKVCAVGFFTSSSKFKDVKLTAGSKINLYATLEKSFFKANPEIRLRIVDIVAQ